MAKNKNRDRKQPQAESAEQVAQPPPLDAQDDQRATRMTPGDVARKGRQKRFGHN